MIVYQAAWACPIDQPPIRDAAIEVDAGVIQSVKSGSRQPVPGSRQLGHVVVLPGLVNAHTHLELSWLRGRVPPANQFTEWVKTLVAIRRGTEQLMTPGMVGPVHDAIGELRASGTVAIGDVT
jgi:cytosine/adenosine deaminase-related metal-dependent hydrolase